MPATPSPTSVLRRAPVSGARGRPFYESGPWAVGIRGYGQIGRVTGDFTMLAFDS